MIFGASPLAGTPVGSTTTVGDVTSGVPGNLTLSSSTSPLGSASGVMRVVAHAIASTSTPLGVVSVVTRFVVDVQASAGTPLGGCAALATVLRYELRGEVRLSGVLVNRRVRAYLRSTGALLGEVDTAVGRFCVPVGFAPAECYVIPIDLSEGATDWLPPTANRLLSVLALDTA